MDNNVVKQILEIRDTFNARKVGSWTGDELSRIAIKLQTLNTYLGEIVAESNYEYNKAYAYRKFKQASDFKAIRQNIDKKIGEADNEALVMAKENVNNEIEKQYQADLLNSLHDDIEKLVMTLQTRISQLKLERINSNLNE